MSVDWDELAALALGRQFPVQDLSPAELMSATGPIQSQTARATFIGLGARSGSATHSEITAAFQANELVRGSCIRGTVHTATPSQQRCLDAVTRVGLRAYWERTTGMRRHPPEELWAAVDHYAAKQWRTPEQLRDHLLAVLSDWGEDLAPLEAHPGKYLAFSIGLVRRPRGGRWEGQGAAEYRSAAQVTGLALPASSNGIQEALRLHLRHHGPSSREDLAWWSGLGLSTVDQALEAISSDLITRRGPRRRDYFDLASAPPARDLPGVRLLPEFDALLCGYDSKARDRFVSPEGHARLWNSGNGLVAPPLLVDGRIGGCWRAVGSSSKRPLDVTLFPGARRPRKAELADAVGRLEASLAIRISDVSVARTSG